MALADDLLLVPADEINYKELDNSVLVELATQRNEPFIATWALGELLRRRVAEAKVAAESVLAHELWDRQLHSFAITTLYKLDKHAALATMNTLLNTERDSEVLGGMIDNVLSDVDEFRVEPGLSLAKRLAALVREIPADDSTDHDQRSTFLELFDHR